tara:strand:+ start:134 stop:952 length:819 start_codon:yes stop_codon:yes gene_type:complete
MIISHKNKFTILRVPKTGSTSLEASARFCGAVNKNDICSETEDAFLPAQNIPETVKEQCRKHALIVDIIEKKTKNNLEFSEQEKAIKNWNRKWIIFMEHNTLDDWFQVPYFSKLNLISREQVLKYKHYGFMRDPIKRYLSAFVFFQGCANVFKKENRPITIESFHEFTLNKLKKHRNILFRPQKDYFYFEGKQIAEPLLFDNWASEASRMINEMGLNPLVVYPRFKEKGGLPNKTKKIKPSVEEWVDSCAKIKDYLQEHFFEDIEFYQKYKK